MTAPSPAAAGLPAEDVERAARAMCQATHPELQATLIPLHDTGDPRDRIAACYACQRAAAAALAEMRPSSDSEADADEAMHRIADRYRDKDAARFAIGDYRDWLRERRPTAAEEAVKRVEAPPGGTQFSLTLNDQEVTVAEVPDLPERGLTSLTYNYRTAIQVRSVDDLDGRVLLHEVLHALLRTDPQQVCPADDPRHEDFVRMLTAGLHDAAGFRRATDGPR